MFYFLTIFKALKTHLIKKKDIWRDLILNFAQEINCHIIRFFKNIFHFIGIFFRTLKFTLKFYYLLFRPTETANITHPSEPSLDFQIINIKSLKEPPFFTSLLEAKSRQQEPSPKSLKEPPFFTSLLEAKSQQQEPSTSFRYFNLTSILYVLETNLIFQIFT